MEFLETLGTVLGIVKKGAEVFNTLNQKDEDTGFASPKLIDLESNNFVASRRKSVPQTMTVAGNANVKGFTASYNTTGVMSG